MTFLFFNFNGPFHIISKSCLIVIYNAGAHLQMVLNICTNFQTFSWCSKKIYWGGGDKTASTDRETERQTNRMISIYSPNFVTGILKSNRIKLIDIHSLSTCRSWTCYAMHIELPCAILYDIFLCFFSQEKNIYNSSYFKIKTGI